MSVITLLTAAGVATGSWVTVNVATPRGLQCSIVGAATATATVVIDGSNDATGTVFGTIGTSTLAGATATDAYSTAGNFQYVRARITAASFTSATVTMNV